MGFFRSKPKFTDRVWLDQEHKYLDIVNSIREAKENGMLPLCIFHFPTSAQRFKQVFQIHKLQVHQLGSLSEIQNRTVETWLQQEDALLMDANLITDSEFIKRKGRNQKQRFSLHLLERYPIPGPDEQLIHLCEARKDFGSPTAYVALDEAWLNQVMGGRVIQLLEKLDMDANDVLSHPMISASIRNAQEKIEKRMIQDIRQHSLEAWLSNNLRE